MQEDIHAQFLRLGILPVTVELLEQLFCLPEGYKIIAVSFDKAADIINFTLMSEALPEARGRDLPRLTLSATVETLPDQPPEYRKITTEVTLP